MGKDYIQLPRSLIQEKYLRDKDMISLIYYLICRADENGMVEISFKEIQILLGLSRQRYRTLLKQLASTAQLTTEITANSTAINIGISNNKPKRATAKTTATSTAKTTAKLTVLSPENIKSKRGFVKPTIQEAQAYIDEKGFHWGTAEMFIDFYDSKGWKVGNQPMKDWKAAMRNWEHKWKEKYVNGTNQTATQSSGRGKHGNPSIDEIAAAVYQRTCAGENYR